MTTLDPPTLPIAAVTRISQATMRSLRRTTEARTQRQRDLQLAGLGQLLDRDEAIEICARMAAWIDRTDDETTAVHELRERHDISLNMIRMMQRTRDIPGHDAPPLRRARRR